MFRRIAQSIFNITKRYPAKPTPSFSPAENSELIGQSFYRKLQKNPTDKTTQALIDFKNSLRDLQTPTESIPQNTNIPLTTNEVSKLISSIDTLNPQELTNLANLYFDGTVDSSIEKDESKAIELWTIAADKGNDEALYSLASCYYQGRGVDHDPELAAEYFLKLAETEHPFACVRHLYYKHNFE